MKKWIVGTLALMVLLVPLVLDVEAKAERIYGQNRFETAEWISKRGWMEADTIVLARGDQFPDALAGTPLAYKEDAPILLTPPDKLDNSVKVEIERLKPSKVIILGGTGAISSSVENELKKMKLTVERIAGENRFETAVKIAEKVGFEKKTAIIADGRNFPDALAVAPYAAKNGYPILLVGKEMPSEVKGILNKLDKTIVVGGENAVNKTVYNQLPGKSRLAGANRYATAAEIIKHEFKGDITSAYVATGQNFADALTGSVLAAKNNKPVILVMSDRVPDETMQLVKDKNTNDFIAFGGTTAISDKVLEQLQSKGVDVKNENPAYDPEYPEYRQWLNFSRISPQAKERYEEMGRLIKEGTARPEFIYKHRFKAEELLWTYYDGPIPSSPYEKEAMQRLAEKRFEVSSWDEIDEFEKAYHHGSIGSYSSVGLSILESFGFNDEGHLEWVVVRPVGMRHAFKLTVEEPVGSIIRNRGWAGQSYDKYDAEWAKVATPELMQLIVDTKVPIVIETNVQLADDGYDDYSQYTTLREREIDRCQSEYIVKDIFGGDFAITIGGSATMMKQSDLEQGSKLIPPEFLERQFYEKGSNLYDEDAFCY